MYISKNKKAHLWDLGFFIVWALGLIYLFKRNLMKCYKGEHKGNSNQLVPGTGKKFPYFAKYSLSRSIIKNSNIIPYKQKVI